MCLQEGSAGRAGAHISLPAAAASVLLLYALPPAAPRVCRPQPPGAGQPGESAALQEVPHQLRDRGKGSQNLAGLELTSRNLRFQSNTIFVYLNSGAKHGGGQRVQRRH